MLKGEGFTSRLEGALSFKDDLLTVPQREEGGRTAYDRFEYQTAWGISKLLDLHEAGRNYAVAFEFHDDIVALDDADAPSSATFYQVKTQESGNWSLARIARRPTSKGVQQSSFAGKMFDNLVRFGAVVEKLVFVSNQPLPEVLLVHGECQFSSGDKEKLKKFVEALVAENPGFKDPEHTRLFFFAFSDLNLSNYEHALLGRITNFLDQELGLHIPSKPFAQALNDECRSRSKAIADVSDFNGLTKSKLVTRKDMVAWLKSARERHEHRPDWSSVASELTMPFAQRVMVERAWKAYQAELQSRWNASTLAMTINLRNLIDDALEGAESLVGLVDAVFPRAKQLVRTWKRDATDDLVKAAILYEHKR
jgi:hypothetical protein